MSILLVENEARLRQALARSLTARGHRVDEMAICHEAVVAATSHSAGLLLLDVNLPDASGWNVRRELRAEGRRTPTVILSAVPPCSRRVREFKALAALHKPLNRSSVTPRPLGITGATHRSG